AFRAVSRCVSRSERCRIHAYQETKRRSKLSISKSCDRWKGFTRGDAQLTSKSRVCHGRSRLRIRAMERQRQRRLLAELRLGSGWQRQIPDQCWRLIRELERQRTKVSLVQSRQIIHKGNVERVVLNALMHRNRFDVPCYPSKWASHAS